MFRTLITALLAILLIASPAHAATDWVDVAAKVRPSIARLQGVWDGKITTVCTAFSINEAKNYFLTANHCDLRQSFTTGDGDTVVGTDDHKIWVDGHEAFPIFQSTEKDLMVLVVPEAGSVPALHRADLTAPGEAVLMYGWGFGLDLPFARIAHVAVPNTEFPVVFTQLNYGSPENTYTLYDAPFVHGQSGGPIVDADGKVISLCQANIPDNVGISATSSELQVLVGKYWEP